MHFRVSYGFLWDVTFSETLPDSKVLPVENVCMYNNFLNEIIGGSVYSSLVWTEC